MTQFLPPNLLALFAPRDPIPFLSQLEKLPHEKHHKQPYSGIAPFIKHFEVRVNLLRLYSFFCKMKTFQRVVILCRTFRILEMLLHLRELKPEMSGWRGR